MFSDNVKRTKWMLVVRSLGSRYKSVVTKIFTVSKIRNHFALYFFKYSSHRKMQEIKLQTWIMSILFFYEQTVCTERKMHKTSVCISYFHGERRSAYYISWKTSTEGNTWETYIQIAKQISDLIVHSRSFAIQMCTISI